MSVDDKTAGAPAGVCGSVTDRTSPSVFEVRGLVVVLLRDAPSDGGDWKTVGVRPWADG